MVALLHAGCCPSEKRRQLAARRNFRPLPRIKSRSHRNQLPSRLGVFGPNLQRPLERGDRFGPLSGPQVGDAKIVIRLRLAGAFLRHNPVVGEGLGSAVTLQSKKPEITVRRRIAWREAQNRLVVRDRLDKISVGQEELAELEGCVAGCSRVAAA